MKLDIYNKSGKKTTKKITLSDSVFGITPNEHCVYLTVTSEMAALRQGSHSAKTRSEVSGGGAKPYKQKGTGRSRVGSSRNPSRVHGGVTFAPKPHKYSKKINNKVRQLARKSALSDKVLSENIIILADLVLDSNKTKEFVQILSNLNVDEKKVTILADKINENLFLGSRNIKNVNVIPASSASTLDIMDCQVLISDVAGIELLNSQLAN